MHDDLRRDPTRERRAFNRRIPGKTTFIPREKLLPFKRTAVIDDHFAVQGLKKKKRFSVFLKENDF